MQGRSQRPDGIDGALVYIDRVIGRVAPPPATAEAEPGIAFRIDAAREAYSARREDLFERAEGLDGVGRSDLGTAMIGHLSRQACGLSAAVGQALAVVGDCAQMGRLLNGRSHETAREIILARLSS